MIITMKESVKPTQNALTLNDLKAISNMKNVFMLLLNEKGVARYMNDPLLNLLNTSFDLVAGKSYKEFLPYIFHEYFNAVIKSDNPVSFVDDVLIDGKIIATRWNIYIVKSDEKLIVLSGHAGSILDNQIKQLIKTEEKTISYLIHQTMPFFVAYKGKITEYNKQLGDIIGFDTDKNYIGFQISDYWASLEERDKLFKKIQTDGFVKNHQVKVINLKKEPMDIFVNARFIYDSVLKDKKLEVVLTYSTLQMEFINDIFKNNAILEQKIANRTKKLTNANKLLDKKNKELSNKNIIQSEFLSMIRESEQKIKTNITNNIRSLVLPELNKLRCDKHVKSHLLKHIENIEYNLKDIISNYGSNITNLNILSKRELEIANYIRTGLSSKEISGILSISETTVVSHRNRIRRKLNINNIKMNLTTYLNSL